MADTQSPTGSEEHDQQGDGEHREEGGDERDLGDDGGVATVLQAEDGAVGGHGHGDDQGVDVDHEVREAQQRRQVIDGDGKEDEPEERCQVDGAVAEHRAQRELRHRRTDDEQGRRHGDVAKHGERLADERGDIIDLEGHDGHCEVGGEHRRRVENFLLEPAALNLTAARDEHCADGKHGKRVDDVEDGGIEHSLVAEDGGDDGIAHEADVAEHQREAHDALVLLLARQVAGQEERHRRKHDVGDDADGEQRQDVAAVGQLARHRRREDERGTGDIDDQPRQLAVEVAA